MKKLSEILTGPETWIQKAYHGMGGRRCLAAALIDLLDPVTFGSPILHREYARLRTIIGTNEVERWNDTHTWDDVSRVVETYDRDRMLNP